MDYLDLEDTVVVRFVSRKWYEKWTAPDVCLAIVEKFFPDVLFQSYLQLSDREKTNTRAELGKWAIKATVQALKYQHGWYRSAKVYQREAPVNSRITSSYIQYNNAKIAELILPYEISIKFFVTGEKRVYMREDRAPILKWWLSDNLLIAYTRQT